MDSTFKMLIEQTSQVTALKVAAEVSKEIQEVRKDLSKAFERLGQVETRVGMSASNGGLIREIRVLQEDQKQFRLLAEGSGVEVNKWKYMFIGGCAVVSAIVLVITGFQGIQQLFHR